MKLRTLVLSVLIGCATLVSAQVHLRGFNQDKINPELMNDRWPAHWISVPGEQQNAFGVYLFRKSLNLSDAPKSFIINITADNRYKLYVNGQLASLGPARGDVLNWNFETVDIAKYLNAGKNIVAVLVWNFAEHKPVAQMSQNKTGLLIQGNGKDESVLNTDGTWLCTTNRAYTLWHKSVPGYYAIGTEEHINSKDYPWEWQKQDFDDSSWKHAQQDESGAFKGARDYPGRALIPSPIPQVEMKLERMIIRKSDNVKVPDNFAAGTASVTIPANSNVNILLDNKVLTSGYLSLIFSKGKDATISIGYTEGMYETNKDGNYKGNRNDIEGKKFLGYEDEIIADGGSARHFEPLWWRTWRYIKLSIQTKDEPLVLNDIYGTSAHYPFQLASSFSAPGHEDMNKMLEIGWRTARLCAYETYMDCPYYEQLQYFGDTRIQALVTLFNTKDPYLVKNALEMGRESMVPDGITMSRYPSSVMQLISSYSLSWIDMIYDYWMYRGDETYLKSLLPGVRSVLSWYEQWLKPDLSLSRVPYWFFADWSNGFDYGEPVREKDGNSAYQDLFYIITLDEVAKMERAFGMSSMAEHYAKIANDMRATIKQKYWDESKGLFADTYNHKSFSQHVNSLAVLAHIVTGKDAADVMTRTLNDKSLIQATIYFSFYVHWAMKEAGLGDQYIDNLKIWRDQMALGLTTWAEMPEPTRSDCHAWGASPNINFYRIILGINSAEPGFKKVMISPSLCSLKDVSGTMPSPAGDISASYKINKKGVLTATLTLPENITGTFVWNGKEYPLNSGAQTLKIAK